MFELSVNYLRNIVLALSMTVSIAGCDSGGVGGGAGDSGGTNNPGSGGATDTTPPVISLNGGVIIDINQGDAFTDPGATANDDVDGDISGSISVGGQTVDTGTPGSYTITYNVSDVAGNSATEATRTVNVNTLVSSGITKFITYTVEDSVNSTETIYTVRGNGNDHRGLHSNIVSGGEILSYSWSSTGDNIAYLGDVDADTITELYSVNPELNTRVKLNRVLTSGGDVVEYRWSPDGMKVAYRANQDDFGKIELYVVDSDGQNRVKVSSTLVGGGNVEQFAWSPSSTHLLYRADATVNDQFGYHVAASDGSSSSQINTNSTGTVQTEFAAEWSPMGNFVSYVTDKEYIYNLSDASRSDFSITSTIWSDSENYVGGFGAVSGIYTVIDVDAATSVDITLPSTSSADSTRSVSFLPGQDSLAVINRFSGIYIYSAVGALIDNEDFGIQILTPELTYSPHLQTVLIKDIFASANTNLVAYDFNLGAAVLLPVVRGGSDAPSWSQDSTRVLFYPDASFQDETLISPDGSGLVDLETSTSSGFTADAQWVGNDVYLAGSDVAGLGSYEIIKTDKVGANLVTIAISGSTHAFLSDTRSFDPDGPSFRLAGDDSFLVYRRDSITPGEVDELHSVSADGTGDVQVNINLTPFVGLSISDYSIQP